jgi:hypothetical protein
MKKRQIQYSDTSRIYVFQLNNKQHGTKKEIKKIKNKDKPSTPKCILVDNMSTLNPNWKFSWYGSYMIQ